MVDYLCSFLQSPVTNSFALNKHSVPLKFRFLYISSGSSNHFTRLTTSFQRPSFLHAKYNSIMYIEGDELQYAWPTKLYSNTNGDHNSTYKAVYMTVYIVGLKYTASSNLPCYVISLASFFAQHSV